MDGSTPEELQGDALNIVKRLTPAYNEELKAKVEEITASRKTAFAGARMTAVEYAMLELIAAKLMTSKSDALRYLIRIGYGLLNGIPEIKAGNVVIQNPIVNMNINNNHNENRNEVKVELPKELERKLDDILDLLEFIAYQSSYPRNIKRRAESGYQALRRLRKMLLDMN